MKKIIKSFSCIIFSVAFLFAAITVYAAEPAFTKEDVYKSLIQASVDDLQKKYNVNNVDMDIFSPEDWDLLLNVLWKTEVENQQDSSKIPENIDEFLEDIFPVINTYFISTVSSVNNKTVGDCLDVIYTEAEKAGFDVSANRKSHENEVFYDNSTLPENNKNNDISVASATDKTETTSINTVSENADSTEITANISNTDDENDSGNKFFYAFIIVIAGVMIVSGIMIVVFVKRND